MREPELLAKNICGHVGVEETAVLVPPLCGRGARRSHSVAHDRAAFPDRGIELGYRGGQIKLNVEPVGHRLDKPVLVTPAGCGNTDNHRAHRRTGARTRGNDQQEPS